MADDDLYSPAFVRFFGRIMRVFCAVWFRFRFEGAERVPAGPCIFVGNHSGIGIADILCLFDAGPRFFPGRRMCGMMHDLFVKAPLVGHVSRAMGAVRAEPAAARDAIARGRDVVVFPGGNLDACRPMNRARDVIFGSRRGYVKLALETRAVVVPIATRGSHYTYLLLPWIGTVIGSRFRKSGLGRDEVVPIPIMLPVTIVIGALFAFHVLPIFWLQIAIACLLLPNPVPIRMRVLEPIDVYERTKHVATEKRKIEVANALVHDALARAVAAP